MLKIENECLNHCPCHVMCTLHKGRTLSPLLILVLVLLIPSLNLTRFRLIVKQAENSETHRKQWKKLKTVKETETDLSVTFVPRVNLSTERKYLLLQFPLFHDLQGLAVHQPANVCFAHQRVLCHLLSGFHLRLFWLPENER